MYLSVEFFYAFMRVKKKLIDKFVVNPSRFSKNPISETIFFGYDSVFIEGTTKEIRGRNI